MDSGISNRKQNFGNNNRDIVTEKGMKVNLMKNAKILRNE